YSGVICCAADAATAHQIELAAGDMPVVFINAQPEEDQLKSNKYIYVGSPEEDAGRYEGEYVYNKLGKPSEMNLIILKGEKGHSATIARTAAAKNYIKDQGCKVNVTFSDFANWTPEGAYQMMDMAKKVGAKYDAVICNNDSMAVGVINWMKDNGVDPKQVPVCGVDATAEGCQSILDGQMQFTCQQNAAGQAKAALEAVKTLASGKRLDSVKGATGDGKYVWVPFNKVEASNVKDFM
ncbi:MAG: substrate-binding domain-containing protein, partial [Lachnospiraceae bacterium]|nr:substrate-binding domain-containing protein [Lachnospiraceae bacterium]